MKKIPENFPKKTPELFWKLTNNFSGEFSELPNFSGVLWKKNQNKNR